MIRQFATLYKKDTKGKLRTWTMEVEGDSYRTISGLDTGQLVISEWRKAKPKNVGKANATTAEEQAIAEVNYAYTKKLEGDYFLTPDQCSQERYFKPMLAEQWEDRKSNIDWTQPVYGQPKLDGIRCVASSAGLHTRNGKPIVAVPHIQQALEPIFKLYPDAVIDGELYNHQFKDDFDSLVSMIKKTKPSDEAITLSKKWVEFHVYDFPTSTQTFGGRHLELSTIVSQVNSAAIQLVPTVTLSSEDEALAYYNTCLDQGYEGAMVRLDTAYENTRSKSLLKVKPVYDDEFEVVDVVEGQGNWAGCAKSIVIRLADGTTCESGIMGTKYYAARLLKNRTKLIGKQVTVMYRGITPDGKLRHGVVKVVHESERW